MKGMSIVYWFCVFGFHFLLSAEVVEEPKLAPLIPLEPQFPLGLTQANRQLLIDNPQLLEEEKERIREALERHTFPWITLVLLLGCGSVGWVAYLTKENWFKWKMKTPIALSSREELDQAFAHLQKEHFLEQGLFQQYYAGLGTILLQWLQMIVGRRMTEMTSKEIMQALEDSSALSEGQKQKIGALLTAIDQVKFAGKSPSKEEAQEWTNGLTQWTKTMD